MEERKNNKKILKRIGAIVGMLIVTIVSFSLPFISNFSPKFKAKNLVASADEVTTNYVFNASDLYNFHVRVNNWGSSFNAINVLFSASSSHTLGDEFISLSPNFNYAYSNGSSIVYIPFDCFDSTDTLISNYNLPLDNNVYFLGFAESQAQYLQGTRVYIRFLAQENFNANVYSVNLRLSNQNLNGVVSSTEKYLILTYYDENNRTLQIEFTAPDNYIFAERTYYLANSFDDNELYNNGYNAGFNAGSADGETKGYKAGYNAGEIVGYNNGYSHGAESAGRYTFTGLLSAVIDVPVQTFMSLFNFELLGVNLAGFFTGLLTLAFIITIVRLVMP